jgi:PTH2 family peptidyl-tRNA hydrolase
VIEGYPVKQVIVVRDDLGIDTGKLVTQACHAAVLAYRDVEAAGTEEKEVVHADGPTLMKRRQRAKDAGVHHQLVQDAGKADLEPRTIAALAVGPAADDDVDAVVGDLPRLEENPNAADAAAGGSDTRPE